MTEHKHIRITVDSEVIYEVRDIEIVGMQIIHQPPFASAHAMEIRISGKVEK